MPGFSDFNFKRLLQGQRPVLHLYGWRQQAWWGLSLGILTAFVTLLLLSSHPSGRSLERDTLDFWFSLRGSTSPAVQPSGEVAILAVDDTTLRRWGGRVFDANDVSRLLVLMRERGITSAALAWRGLADGSLRTDGSGLPGDFATSGIGYLPLNFYSTPTAPGDASDRPPGNVYLQRFSIGRVLDANGAVSTADGDDQDIVVQAPPPEWLNMAAGAGQISILIDSDGQVRRSPLVRRQGGHIYPSLALAAALGSLRTLNADGSVNQPSLAFVDAFGNATGLDNARFLEINGGNIPLLAGGEMLLNFPYLAAGGANSTGFEAGGVNLPGNAVAPFRTISISQALDNPLLLNNLNGYRVVMGPTAPAVSTWFATPTGRRISETELHAVVLDNLLSGRALQRAPEVWIWLLTCALCAITGGFTASKPPMWSAMIVLLCMAAAATLSLGLFDQQIWLDISIPWLATGLTFLSGVISRARRQERESTRIGSTIEALAEVSAIITTQRQPSQTMERILSWTQNLMRAEASSILLLDESKKTLHFIAATGPKAEEVQPFTLALGEGIAGWVAQHGEAVISNDVKTDDRFYHDISDNVDFQTNAILCVPMRARDALVGVLEVINRTDGSPFTQEDADLLGAIANQAALVIENARLYDMLSKRVVQSESDLATTNQRLQAEKNTLQTVLQSMTDAVIVCDRDETVRLVNPAAANLLELKPVSPEQKLRDLVPELVLDPVEGAESARVQLQRGDIDSPRFIESRSAPLQNAEGLQIGTIWVLADVTERRGIEQAKSDFVSFVAHEMRSPLTSISGFSSMLQKQELQGNEPPPPNVRPAKPMDSANKARFLGIIHNESERLTRLINNLLDVARIEAGRGIELNRDTLYIPAFIAEVAATQRHYSSRHRIALEIAPNLPPVQADRDKVAQILINFVTNALKYSPGGVVTIGARAIVGTRGGPISAIEIAVHDEGPGIAPEQKPHLFERFGRIASETQPTQKAGVGGKAKPTGTGLGLFLTRHLVEAHGGQVSVSSEPGQGATFRFTLPLSPPSTLTDEISSSN